jgi:5,10-methylenetetrahydrofolate reductase
MSKVIVLFNLKPETKVEEYEKFARELDLPIVNGLPSVKKFEVLKATGTMAGTASPYQYIEIIDLHSLEQLGKDVQTEAVQKIAVQFRALAEAPIFILTENL